jgi:predicted nucleic acid-binding protein
MIVVADASPLIFLTKIRKLDLIQGLLGHDIRVPEAVHQELFAGSVDPVEQDHLNAFLADCVIAAVRRPRHFAAAMSSADNAALTLALRCKADILLCDDRITRSVSEIEGVRPLGTLGILLRAVDEDLIATGDARTMIDTLISAHDFRISIELYQAVLTRLSA